MAIRFANCLPSCLALASLTAHAQQFHRVVPLGGERGTRVEVELIGEDLAGVKEVRLDTPDLVWVETIEAAAKKVRGAIRIAPGAALGPHLMHARLPGGRTNSRLFNVTQFPSVAETEPNDPPGKPQRIELRPQVIHGYMEGDIDVDVYEFEAKAGERWTFEIRSLEYGSHLECELALFDSAGRRTAFNDDRDDYLESPFLEHTFTKSGVYRLKLDQYRGPQGVECGYNCVYMLEMSQLGSVTAAAPLGARPGTSVRVRLMGSGLESIREAWMSPARLAEYYRLTLPYTLPVRTAADRPDPPRIDGQIERNGTAQIEASFKIPADAPPGVWRIHTRGPRGEADGINFEISPAAAIDASLDRAGQEDSYPIEARAGQPFHAWTLAAQLGLPRIDTVLELFDPSGKLLAEHDDLMTGQGTVIGNPDSSLYYTPSKDEKLRLVVRDRTGRGGPDFAYRLHLGTERPGFQLQTDPEEFTVPRGGEATLTALLVREPGFVEGVEVWVEGLPPGASSGKGSIEANTYFGPSDDGDNVIIPRAAIAIRVPENLTPGDYPLRVFGKSQGGLVVEAVTTLWIGPKAKRNDIRRPVPATTMTVADR